MLDLFYCAVKPFGGARIEVLENIIIPCRHKGRRYNINFQVVNVDHGFLLSESGCLAWGLIKYCRSISAKHCYSENVNSLRLEAGKMVNMDVQRCVWRLWKASRKGKAGNRFYGTSSH